MDTTSIGGIELPTFFWKQFQGKVVPQRQNILEKFLEKCATFILRVYIAVLK